jgi:hypothetical protein
VALCTRTGGVVAVFWGLLLPAGPAAADLTFQVDIKGTIFTDDAPTVKVTCKGKDGTTATFPNADLDVESLLSFNFPTSCGLHSAAGLFGDGERFNDQVVDDEATVAIVTDKKGAETSQRVYATSKITNGMGEATMALEYASTFVKDKANGEIDPPLKKVQGSMILVLDAADQFFVGTFKTGSLVP